MASTGTRSQSTFRICWNGRFTSWMCSNWICSNCLMLYVNMDQYGSLRKVSSSLLNLCLGGLRQFWRQKVVQPDTRRLHLKKCVYASLKSLSLTATFYTSGRRWRFLKQDCVLVGFNASPCVSQYWCQRTRCACLRHQQLRQICSSWHSLNENRLGSSWCHVCWFPFQLDVQCNS